MDHRLHKSRNLIFELNFFFFLAEYFQQIEENHAQSIHITSKRRLSFIKKLRRQIIPIRMRPMQRRDPFPSTLELNCQRPLAEEYCHVLSEIYVVWSEIKYCYVLGMEVAESFD